MKFLVQNILFLIFLLNCFSTIEGQDIFWDLRISIKEVSLEAGQLVIDLYSDEQSYRKEDPMRRIILTKEKSLKEYETRVKLAAGRYAIALFDDRNFNNKIDRNFFGYPLEGFGFYGLDHFPLKKPYFLDISVEHGKANKTVVIKMQYR